ncbi:uncharacterized protein LOC142344773 isoform X2 [Convolutriloba macropyga]|uniref:uncharacterized protein LOC142344773 isoform X2 n=1 Tax=Convolutriloba macropyga TaxID=536237 RepID=UPI003F524D3A
MSARPSSSQMRGQTFQLTEDVDVASTLQDPEKLLSQLNEKYHRQKVLYKETRNYYFKLNLWVFFLPLLVVQGMTTVLTHMSGNPKNAEWRDQLRIVVAVLNGASSVWTAAQLKLGWSQKTQSANSTLIKYRDMSAHVSMFCTILNCQINKCVKGVVEFVESCYENEKTIMQNEITIPPHIIRRYDTGQMKKENALGNIQKQLELREKEERRKAEKAAKKTAAKKKSSSANKADNPKAKDNEEEEICETTAAQLEADPNEDAPLISKPEGTAPNKAGKSSASGEKTKKVSDDTTEKAEEDLEEKEKEENFDGTEDSNMNAGLLLKSILCRYRAFKRLYGNAGRYYYLLNLGCFYCPLVFFGTLNTILTSLTVDDADTILSMAVIKISALVSILTGLQMTLQWENEGSKCLEAHQMYRKLDSEISYRLMLSEQGVPIKNAAEFAWKCRDVEDQTVDTEPKVPNFIIAQVSQESMETQKKIFTDSSEGPVEETSNYIP